MGEPYLLATDGSDQARRAEDFFIEAFDPSSTRVIVVSVTEQFPPGIIKEGESLTKEAKVLRNELSEEVRSIAESSQDRLREAGFDVEITLLAGDPGSEICEHARKVDAAGIVLGRRGHGEVTELLMGSVSQYVVHHSPVPVTLVPYNSG
ncbi:MAG: universal stress protein [bacterium]